MSSTPTLTQSSSSSSNFRVNYSDYVADITQSPRSVRKLPATSGIGHHINSVNNSNSNTNRPSQATQQAAAHMPHYGGGAEKCARCSKSVYLAEKKVGAGRSFHSSCFNCYTCHRKLDTSTLSEHKGEVFCKPCYTKQFGAHGLISGVSMSTEKAPNQPRPPRRSSFGSDLDAPVVTYEQTKHRANSSENLLREDYGNKPKDDHSQKFPRPTEHPTERPTPSGGRTNGGTTISDSAFRRPSSPIRVEPNPIPHRQSSIPSLDTGRQQLISHGERISYGSGASALVDIPVVVNPRRAEVPTTPSRTRSRSPSPSPSNTSNDSYRRQSSREQQVDSADRYSRMTSNDSTRQIDQRPQAHENVISTIPAGNPLGQQSYRQSSSYESKYTSSTANASNYHREQSHSPESSPTAPVTNHRSPSPTNVQIPSVNTYRPAVQHDLSSPPRFAPPPRQEYYNIPISTNTNPVNRRSPSPQRDEHRSSALNEFMTKTNFVGNTSSPAGGNFSALGALAQPRYQRNSSDDDSDQ